MTIENHFDKLLAYLQDHSPLSDSEISSIQESLGSYEIDLHRQTAIKIMNSGVFTGERFKRKTGERECHSIGNFEQFIAKVAKAIDDHSDEMRDCLDSGSPLKPTPQKKNISPDLAVKVDSYVKDFISLEQQISLIKGIRSDSLAKIRKMLESLNKNVRKRLSQPAKKKDWDKARIPHQLVGNLIRIIKEHNYKITKLATARVIVEMLTPFDLKLKVHSIRTEIRPLPKNPLI